MTPADLMPPEAEYPTFVSDWRMSREALEAIAELLCERRPQSILETGPGLSSWLFFRYAEQTGAAYAIVDHEGEYHERFANWCLRNGFGGHTLYVRPLASDGYYDLMDVPFPVCDLVCLDGPIRSGARNGATARAFVGAVCDPAGATLIVDDANRAGEAALVAWLLDSGFSRERDVPDGVFPRRRTTILSGRFDTTERVP